MKFHKLKICSYVITAFKELCLGYLISLTKSNL